MTTSDTFLKTDGQIQPPNDMSSFEDQTLHFCSEALEEFKQVTRQYALFHITFFAIGVMELVAFVLFFSFLTKTTIFAFSLAGLFLTIFTYFVLLFYFQAKKPQQLLDLRTSFLKNCKALLQVSPGTSEYHLKIASGLKQMLTLLHRQEYSYYSLPASFETLSPLMQKFSVWTHWKDLHQMKELLLLMIIKEKIEIIKLQPTDLEAHAHLADAYLALSRLYMDPRKLYHNEEHLFVSYEYSTPEMHEKFVRAAQRAIEEYKILDAYVPDDPWVHAQLASIYRALDRPQEEMREYEAILKVTTSDSNVLLRLGVLYFEQGYSAKALALYEILNNNNDPNAAELIAYYDLKVSDEYPDA
jgi:tetratricopeptide (TPR) repeat protein